MIDHQTSAAGALPERYALGKLRGREREEFEEHLLGCAACLRAVDESDALQDGLRVLAVQESAAAHRPRLQRSRMARRWAPLAVGAAAALGGIGLALHWNGVAHRSERDLAAARRSADQLSAELGQARNEVSAEREARRMAEAARAEALRPMAGLPVFALTVHRSQDPRQAQVVRVGQHSGWMVLLVDREDPPRFASYRVSLLGEGNRELWRQEPILPASGDQLAVALHGDGLVAGGHTLVVEGLDATGRPVPVGRFPFRVVREAAR